MPATGAVNLKVLVDQHEPMLVFTSLTGYGLILIGPPLVAAPYIAGSIGSLIP